MRDVEIVTLDGGTVNSSISASGGNAPAGGITLNLISGTVSGGISGSSQNDVFTISGDLATDTDPVADGRQAALAINSAISGGGGTADEVRLITDAVVDNLNFGDFIAGDLSLRDVETITIDGGTVTGTIDASAAPAGVTFNLVSGTAGGDITGSGQNDIFIVSGDIATDTDSSTDGLQVALAIGGLLQGGSDGTDEVRLIADAVVANLNFGTFTAGDLSVQDVETITLDGGMVTGTIDASGETTAGVTFNLISGRADGNITGSGQNDVFMIAGDIATDTDSSTDGLQVALAIGGLLQGGSDGTDEVQLIANGVVNNLNFGTFTAGDLSLRDVETITLNGGTVNDAIDVSAATVGITFNLIAGVAGNTSITGSGQNDIFIFSGDITSGTPPLDINGFVQGGDGQDEVRLIASAVVDNLNFSSSFVAADLNVQTVETITLDGGTVNTAIDASDAVENMSPPTSGATSVTGVTFNLMEGVVGPSDISDGCDNCFAITGSGFNDLFIISGDIGLGSPRLDINGLIQGGAGQDEVRLISGAAMNNLDFGSLAANNLSLRDVEIITLDGGTVNGNITGPATATTFYLTSGRITGDVVGGAEADVFNFQGGTVFGNVTGGDGNDVFNLQGGTIGIAEVVEVVGVPDDPNTPDVDETVVAVTGVTASGGAITGGAGDDAFNLGSNIVINGFLDGGVGGNDSLNYTGATAGTDFDTARGGLAIDGDTTNTDGSVRNIEAIADVAGITSLGAGAGGAPAPGAGLRGLTVSGIEVLNLSPALNLYGAMSDALMQFGQQTAQGFALADLNLATGRATSLVSKDSPFSKGRIWAHKITHSGNGKGSIGLGITGLTARADSDYDYEMSLTQHGFDAPLATTKLGAFNLRAVSHTITGTIETNIAEAQVSGYGAGVAMMWNSETLSAHITSLASAYEVDATTSSLNPRAIVNEVSEGSFSAVNAVVSAGVADTRKIGHSLALRTTADIVWQTLSLDDFNETGADGISINFDKATRFTARVGAGLEAEHWFSDVAFVHETSSGGTLSSGLSQDYRQDDGTAIEMRFGGKIADLATGLTLKAHLGLRTSLDRSDALDPSARFDLNWRF